MVSRVDDRGRIVIPKDVREAYGLEPGEPIVVESREDGVLIKRRLTRAEILAKLLGCINEDTRDPHAEPIDPLRVKDMWERHL